MWKKEKEGKKKNEKKNIFLFVNYFPIITNVLKTGLVTESKKLSVHGSLVKPVVEPRLNR